LLLRIGGSSLMSVAHSAQKSLIFPSSGRTSPLVFARRHDTERLTLVRDQAAARAVALAPDHALVICGRELAAAPVACARTPAIAFGIDRRGEHASYYVEISAGARN
jgi:hypothetical protein